ncbi:lasso peptide biosynthesis B2 protein [Sphaerisporangium flaviroseum]|uniref:Lasso peptide biosynthesis B2 protein n=1 Tax=Sphaerisporangium flaviroseum TaxID=509199 RepID=A0ABP7J3W5_9ACTN
MLRFRLSPRMSRHSDSPHGAILLDGAADVLYATNSTAADLLTIWNSGGGFEDGVVALTLRYPHVPVERIRKDVSLLLDHLVRSGVLEVSLPERTVGIPMVDAAPLESKATLPSKAVAIVCLTLACALLLLRFERVCRMVGRARIRQIGKPVTAEQAARIVATVHRVARHYPGRAACLEISLAAVVWAALSFRRLDWCLGVAVDPYRFHAWVEVDGKPIEPADDTWTRATYRKMMTL